MQIAAFEIMIHNALLNPSDMVKRLFRVYIVDIELNFQPSVIII